MQTIIGQSNALLSCLDQVGKLANIKRPVLIIGERGSGKELIAERLHFLSAHWQEQFNKLNCATLSDSLIDSELFGHESGAFTGAQKRRKGLFERSHKGSLFLDEITTLPLRSQEKLLRVTEYGELQRLGGETLLEVDVRLIAASHDDIVDKVNSGEFRADLLDRLSFDVIQVPALRDRGEDIELLAEHFAKRFCAELGLQVFAGLGEHAKEQLYQYHWPGNIRELRNVIERSIVRSDKKDEKLEQLIIEVLPASTIASEVAAEKPAHNSINKTKSAVKNGSTRSPSQIFKHNLKEEIRQLELQRLKAALEHNQHHQSRAAESLALSYHQFRALLKKHQSELGKHESDIKN
ncbi:phage shock protein operon transcriptional activator [Agaribacterium haliotis]|uniref:phage shock protein operon transcriptional activator n=1 Tax=Agaribacterium haliotis TaxID=2013869 RepID=UPI000BB56EB9|nr:phage shock protein operon transcriptional activator [Agaribacterium haliotis]